MSNVQVACNGLSVFLNNYFLDPGLAGFFLAVSECMWLVISFAMRPDTASICCCQDTQELPSSQRPKAKLFGRFVILTQVSQWTLKGKDSWCILLAIVQEMDAHSNGTRDDCWIKDVTICYCCLLFRSSAHGNNLFLSLRNRITVNFQLSSLMPINSAVQLTSLYVSVAPCADG